MTRLLAATLAFALTGGAALLAGPATAQSIYGYGSNPASHGVQGYTTPNGSYVQPHQQTNPNNTQMDNYGTRGNFNPQNGTYGTRAPKW
jgi:hypothetical protein